LKAYFPEAEWSDQKNQRLQAYLRELVELEFPIQSTEVHIQIIENQDWNALWKQSIKPFEIEGKILIKPSWISIVPSSDRIVIEIDPQMAFGTGTHETTQLMLKLLLKHLGSASRILDMGTGTGILAIAAAKLSSASVIAFDNDPIAITTAQQNSINNQVHDRITLWCGILDAIRDAQFDLILANINRPIIVESLPKIYQCLNSTGRVIFSGILATEEKRVVTELEFHNLRVVDQQQQGEWVGLVVQKKGNGV